MTNLIPTSGFVKDAMFATGGFIGTKMAANIVLPMIGINQPIVRIAVKGGLAVALGYVGKMFLGAQAGSYLALGGAIEAVNDAVQTYVTPFVPALAVSSYAELQDMSAYPELSSYASLSGIVEDGDDLKEQV